MKVRRTINPQKKEFISDTAFTNFTTVMLRELKQQAKDLNYVPRKYTRQQISTFMENPVANELKLREVSHYLFLVSGAYRRLIWYWASMLTLDHVLVPDRDKMVQTGFKKQLEKANKYMDNYNIKYEFGKVLGCTMLDGVFFGLERVEKDQIMIQRVPSDLCKITHLINGVYAYSMDMSYFDNVDNKKKLNTEYPPEITELYNAYKNSNVKGVETKWQLVDDSIGVCYKLDHMMLANIPPLSGVFVDLIYLEGAKAISYAEDLLANFRLLVAQLPWKKDAQGEGDLLLTWPTSEKFWNILKGSVPDSIGVAVTPFEKIESVSLDRVKDKGADKVQRAENNVYTAAGASNGLFNSQNDNSISLNRGIEVDEGMLLLFLRYLERFFRNRMAGMNLPFRLIFPDLTLYNRKEMAKEYRTDAQSGMPKSFLAAARGYSTSDMLNLLAFENDHLKITEKMIPLPSSHTATDNEGGRPTTEDANDLDDAGVKTREGDGNATRAK